MKNRFEQEQIDLAESYQQSKRNRLDRNPTLTKNMPNVKWDQIPPVRGPNPQGIVRSKNEKLFKTSKKPRRQSS
tara:strand:- start:355 stop:576 length:222 start_codon:yes stop_codon:yes gene_type:complete